MRNVQPQVHLVARPDLDYDEIARYLHDVGGESWLERLDRGNLDEDGADAPGGQDAQNLAELAGRLCYRSWEPGLNPNVTRVRTDQTQYLQNILRSAHGSVLEHATFSFVLHNVSRVSCYDDDTEVLTDKGWIPWPKIDGTETFGTLNQYTGELQYQQATEVFHAEYEGPMYRVSSEQVDLCVTPNHRMWIQPYDTRATRRGTQSFLVEQAQDILHKRVKYQKTALWSGETPKTVDVPGTTRTWTRHDTGAECVRHYPGVSFPAEPFARFLGYYLSEGCVNGHQIILSQNRGVMLDNMAATIRQLGLPAYLPETGGGCVRTQCTPLRDMLSTLGYSYEKWVPAMVQQWSPATIRTFLHAMVDGDGPTHSSGHQVIYTASRELADTLQVLAIKAGMSANVRIDDRTGMKRTLKTGQSFVNLRPCYIVSLLTRRLQPLVNSGRQSPWPNRHWNDDGYHDGLEHYSGSVHCVKVPNELLWVRRNGKPVVSGNTHELVRHRPGTAISQESMRFVRLTDVPFWFPEWAQEDRELMERATGMLEQMEQFQRWMAEHFELDEEGVKFGEKKHRTSFMRRFAPEGVATGLVWSANIRTLRHTIEARTAPGAEEEIRLLFGKIGELMAQECPALFGDYTVEDGAWVPSWRKV